ncbi:MAG: DNA repair protein RecN, partial [Chloroflexota bacterium]|nr:DNA repair protein RecN [Chloroflexota bacterium]
ALKALLAECGIEDEDAVILTRDIGKDGRNLNRLNGRSVPLRFLREIGKLLIDIHGQSDHLSLNDPRQQLLLLDRYADAEELRSRVEAAVESFYKSQRELNALSEDEKELARRRDLLSFQVDEIGKAALHEGEDEELEQESTILSNAEKLKSLSQSAYQALYGEETSSSPAIDRVGEAVRLLKELVQLDAALGDLLQGTESTLYQIEDSSRALREYQDGLEHDPARLEQVELRLDLIRNLKRKYGDSISELIQYARKAEEELTGLVSQDEKRAKLQGECAALKDEIAALSYELSGIRRQAAEEMAKEIEQELSQLNMAQVGFRLLLSRFEAADELTLPNGEICAFNRSGIDRVDFLVSTNPGEPFKPLAKIASTGETSRLMLAIKSTLSGADATPTLIFDEIDIGIGGRSGEVVGRKLSGLSKCHQVICITHLPQVASFADAHYVVRKDVRGDRTSTTVAPVSGQDRLEEISAMLGSLSEPARESAQELLAKAESWKQS